MWEKSQQNHNTTELYSGDTSKAEYLKTSNQVTVILGIHPGENLHPFTERKNAQVCLKDGGL